MSRGSAPDNFDLSSSPRDIISPVSAPSAPSDGAGPANATSTQSTRAGNPDSVPRSYHSDTATRPQSLEVPPFNTASEPLPRTSNPEVGHRNTNPGLATEETIRKRALTTEAISKLSATLPSDRRTHLAATGKQLLNAWRNNKFCDVVIKAEHSLFYAHLEVFVAFTDYFDDIPAQRKQQQINLGLDVRPDDCAAVLKYLYFGELQASAENVYGIWTIAKAMHIHDIDVACATFIERLLTPPNLIYVLEYCEQKNVQDLHAAAYDRFMLTFYEQSSTDLYLEWDIDKVMRLLGCDDIKVKVRQVRLSIFGKTGLQLCTRKAERIRTAAASH